MLSSQKNRRPVKNSAREKSDISDEPKIKCLCVFLLFRRRITFSRGSRDKTSAFILYMYILVGPVRVLFQFSAMNGLQYPDV